MIVDKVRLDSQPINGDAPPAYEASVSPLPSTSVPEVKRPTRSSILIAAKSPQVATSWFNFASPTARQVRATVLGLVRDLVKLQPNDQSDVAISILKSCADACAANNLSINTVLQERSVEGHTPLYWAIIRRPAESAEKDTPDLDLLTALLTLATPLTPATTSDIRLACLLTSNQVLFQRLRTSPEFAPLSATDEMILDATMSLDDILVEDVGGDIGAFAVDFAILRFQKRMRVSKCAILEFIARGRMFRLSFNVATHEHRRPSLPPPGTWYAALSLLEQSPPTWLDSRLLVPAPLEPDVKETGAGGLFGTGKARPRPTLSLRMRTKQQLHPRRGGHGNEIIVSLDGSEAAGGMASLQYVGCPYIAADETLHGRLEASLIRPEAECVIC